MSHNNLGREEETGAGIPDILDMLGLELDTTVPSNIIDITGILDIIDKLGLELDTKVPRNIDITQI